MAGSGGGGGGGAHVTAVLGSAVKRKPSYTSHPVSPTGVMASLLITTPFDCAEAKVASMPISHSVCPSGA